MPKLVARLLDAAWFGVLARLALTFVFWGAGMSMLLDFPSGVAEMRFYGLEPAALFNLASIATLLCGSLLIVVNRFVWLGAGALAVFTALTIPLVHHFWTMSGAEAMAHFHTATEHVTVIGTLAIVAVLSRRARSPAAERTAPFPSAARRLAA